MLLKTQEYLATEMLPTVEACAAQLSTTEAKWHEHDDLLGAGLLALARLIPRLQYPQRYGVTSPSDYVWAVARRAMVRYLARLPREWPHWHIEDKQGHVDCGSLGRRVRLSAAEIESRVAEIMEEVWLCCSGPVDVEIVERRAAGATLEAVASHLEIGTPAVSRRLTRLRREFLERNPEFKATLKA